MDELFAKTIKTLASDIDSKWKVKKCFNDDDDVFVKPQITPYDDFILPKRILPPIPVEKVIKNTDSYSFSVTNVDRLRKTASVWFQPKFTRLRVEDVLKDFEIGVFMIRMNSQNETMVLSYNGEKKVIHIKIRVDDKKGFFIDGSIKIFKNIHAMLANYFINPIFDPNIKLKLPNILMELSHPSHFKFFENMKSDFWFTQICHSKLSEIFVDSLIDINYDSKLQKKNFEESTLSLPGLKFRENRNKKQAFKNESKHDLNIFKKLKSKIFKGTTTSTKPSETEPNSRRKSLPSFTKPPQETKNLKYISGSTSDLEDFDYDE